MWCGGFWVGMYIEVGWGTRGEGRVERKRGAVARDLCEMI